MRAEIGAAVGAPRDAQNITVPERIVGRKVERRITGLGEILARQTLDLPQRALRGFLDRRKGRIPGPRIVVEPFVEERMRIVAPQFGSTHDIQRMPLAVLPDIGEMTAQQIPRAAALVFQNGAVEIAVMRTVDAQPVLESPVGVLLPRGLRIVVIEIVGGQTDEFQILQQLVFEPHTHLRRNIIGLRLVALDFPENVEALFRQVLIGIAVVVGQRKPRLVVRIASVVVVGFLVGIGEVGIGEGIDTRIRRIGLPVRNVGPHVERQAPRRFESQIRLEGVAVGAVLDEHALVIGVTQRKIVVVGILAAAHRNMAVYRHGVAKNHVVPVGVGRSQTVQIGFLRRRVALEMRKGQLSRTHLPHDAHRRIDHRRVQKRLRIFLSREFVPKLPLPGQFLGRIHQRRLPLRPERNRDIRREIDLHLAGLAPLGSHHDDAVRRPGTVDRSSRGILQHDDRLDIVRVHPADTVNENIVETSGLEFVGTQIRTRTLVLHRDPIDHPQRRRIPREVGDAADTNPLTGPRPSRRRRHRNAGQLALHQGIHRGLRLEFQFVGRQDSHRTGNLLDRGLRISRHDDLFDLRGGGLQDHVQTCTPRSHDLLLRLITDK